MTKEDKQLLLKDLCARLPYGVKVHITDEWFYDKIEPYDRRLDCDVIKSIRENQYTVKPYLRPMSSMTEEEKDNLQSLHDIISNENYGDGYSPSAWNAITEWEDYCNARHLDYRGLIPMGLALEAPEGMYKEE